MFKTYRSRLTAYTALLLTFLVVTLAYTYIYSRNVILEEAENNITNIAKVIDGNLSMEQNELLHYTEIVRDDNRIQEYMFMTVKVGTDGEPLENLYNRQFGWLPVARTLMITNNNKIILGKKHTDLIKSVTNHLKYSKEVIFYSNGKNGLEMITLAPIKYQGQKLGTVALTRVLDKEWLDRHRNHSGGALFIEHDGIIQLSNVAQSYGKPFVVDNSGKLNLNNEIFSIRPVMMAGLTEEIPHLWYGMSEHDLLAKLERHSSIILLLALMGCLAIMWAGLMIVRNFNKPLSELMLMTRAVAQGTLPMLNKSSAQNEIGMLSNQFAEMLHALREKQNEIDRVHEKLKQTTITDSLTNLHNRRYLHSVFPKLLAQAQRDSLCLSGIMLDLDFFKQINDRFGHLAGDQCLKHVADTLVDISRANDYVFRIGGEEFFIISMNESRESGGLFAEKIRIAIEQHPASYKNTIIPMTASIGVCHTENSLIPNEALTHVLFHADKALYQAKADGRNQTRVHAGPTGGSDAVWNVS